MLLEPVEDVARVVVLRAGGIGDVVVALPALQALRARYPAAELVLLARAPHAALLAGRPGPVDRVAVMPPGVPGVWGAPAGAPEPPEVEAVLAGLRADGVDLAVQLHGGGAGSNPLVRRLRARVAVGAVAEGAPPLDREVRYTTGQHELLRCLEVVALAGAEPVGLAPVLQPTAADGAAAAPALAQVEPGRQLVAVHPSATDPRRRWPAPRFAAVLDAVVDAGARAVLVGDGADAAAAAAVLAAVRPDVRPAVADLTGRLDLPALVGVLAAADLVLACDSGPRHVAEAVGTATASVFWVGNALAYAPLTRERHRVAVSWRSSCPVCGAGQAVSRCEHDPTWVDDVPVEEVRRHALDLLAGSAARG